MDEILERVKVTRKILNDFNVEELAKALKATGKAKVTIVRKEPKIKRGMVRV
jgi:hypothetical protein